MMMPIAEMREFAGFAPAEQRYIKRSLDIGLARTDAFRRWGRSESENTAIRRQYVAYQDLKTLRALIPHEGTPQEVERFLGKLVRVAAFDLEQERLKSFSAFRFLYERLLGARVRPGWFAQTHAHPEWMGRTLLEILHRGDEHRDGLGREAAARVIFNTPCGELVSQRHVGTFMWGIYRNPHAGVVVGRVAFQVFFFHFHESVTKISRDDEQHLPSFFS